MSLAYMHLSKWNSLFRRQLSINISRIEIILGCRLVLALRQLSSVQQESNESASPDLQFATSPFLANVGAPLRIDDEDEDQFANMDDGEAEDGPIGIVEQDNSVSVNPTV